MAQTRTAVQAQRPHLCSQYSGAAGFWEVLGIGCYSAAVDELITVLLRLLHTFSDSDAQSFATEVQLLRLAGAPGTGKTTFASTAWDQVLPRMRQVQKDDPALWQEWHSHGDPELLLQRLEASWCTQHGPFVFIMDMSDKSKLLFMLACMSHVLLNATWMQPYIHRAPYHSSTMHRNSVLVCSSHLFCCDLCRLQAAGYVGGGGV
jgi:hypothetical protein